MNIEERIIQAEYQLAKAHLSLDLEIIDTLLHPDYLILQQNGIIETKEKVLSSYRTGRRHWDEAEVSELNVHLYDGFCRVVGVWKASGNNDGKLFNYKARFISIWAKDSDNWKNIFYSSSEIE